jgi:hypothetical protein
MILIDNIPIYIQTSKGNLNINKISIGDFVYDYFSGKKLEVRNVIDINKQNTYCVTYNDNRKMFYYESELIWTNNKFYKINDLMNDNYLLNNIEVKQYPIDYLHGQVVNKVFSDPYVAGSSLIYGNQNNNLKRYLFKVYNTSFINRWKFIRGVFDTGYDLDIFPNSCSILHKKIDRLKFVQKILWSLGVISNIKYNDQYILNVLSSPESFPSFFYNINYIEKMFEIMNQNKFKLQIASINPHNQGYSKGLILNKPNSLYLTNNFLPRASI